MHFGALFLSFFFISVGLSINSAALVQAGLWVLLGAAGLIAIKLRAQFVVVFFFSALVNPAARCRVPYSSASCLGQGSVFTLVLLALPAVAGLVERRLFSTLVTGLSISLALTPRFRISDAPLRKRYVRARPISKLAER